MSFSHLKNGVWIGMQRRKKVPLDVVKVILKDTKKKVVKKKASIPEYGEMCSFVFQQTVFLGRNLPQKAEGMRKKNSLFPS